MNYRILVVATMAVLALIGASSAIAQTGSSETGQWTVPRTPDGHPDLQGVWANNSATPLERPETLADKIELTDEEVADLAQHARQLFNGETDAAFGDSVFEAALAGSQGFTSSDAGTGNYNQFWLVDREFEARTSLIVDPPDGRMPVLTSTAAAASDAVRAHRLAHPADSYTDRSNSDRCITYGVPRIRAGYNSYFQFVQTASHVAIVKELIHDVRIIPLDGRPHLDEAVRQWMGVSRGRWEGETLVVETTNLNGKNPFRGQSGDQMRVTERFTRISEDEIRYQFTVEDKGTWDTPWTGEMAMRKSIGPLFEHACHEGNYGLYNTLVGARAEEREAAGK